jgi:hypothetical protein
VAERPAGPDERIEGVTTLEERRPAARRPSLLGQALAAAVLTGGLLGLAVLGEYPLLGGVVAVQLLAVLGFLALTDAPASGAIFVLGLAAAVAADVVVAVDDGNVGGLSGVVALGLVAALLHQLSRRDRTRVTESLADTFVVVTLVCSAACLTAALMQDGGTWPVRAGLAAAGVALVAGRLGDAVIHRPALAVGATRAWPGLLLGLGGAVAVAVLVAGGQVSSGRAALVGLAAGATVATVDLAIDLAAAELSPAPEDNRRVAALRPVSLFLPFTLLGPVLLLAVRLLQDRA